jgi:hypothetical protein
VAVSTVLVEKISAGCETTSGWWWPVMSSHLSMCLGLETKKASHVNELKKKKKSFSAI